MATTADIRNGLCIEFKNNLFVIVEFQHVKPGKGPAFVRTKLKNIKTGRTIDNTFSSGEKLEVARVERRNYQFLYNDGDTYYFMHSETYEQIHVNKEMVDHVELLKEGTICTIMYHTETDTPLTCELPTHITLEVTYTEIGEKGNSVSSGVTKPATVETGAEVNVPLFINTGDLIKIDTRDGSYLERTKQ